MNKRHEFLLNTIGAYEEEIEAHWMINFLANYMPLIYIGASALQFLLYLLYNNYLHPYKVLVQSVQTNEEQGIEMTTLLSQNSFAAPLPKSKRTPYRRKSSGAF